MTDRHARHVAHRWKLLSEIEDIHRSATYCQSTRRLTPLHGRLLSLPNPLAILGEARMSEAVIVSTARTPIGKAFRGAFNITHGATMTGHVIAAAVARAKIDPAEVEDV